MAKQPFTQPVRGLLQGLAAIAVLGLLSIPPLTVALSGTASVNALWTTLRIAALEAFTIIFCAILLGAFRLFFIRIVKPRRVQKIHIAVAATGFSLAIAHGTCVFIFGRAGYRPAALWLGPTMLTILTVSITVAILRTRLKHSWRWIHRVNYLVFLIAILHSFTLGADTRAHLFLKTLMGFYAAVAVAGFFARWAQLRSAPVPPKKQQR